MASVNIAKLVKFGNGGDTVYFGRHHECSGYGNPDGTLAIDVRAAVETDDGFKWVFRGPMVNVDLPDESRETCPLPDPIFASAMAESGNQFGTLLALQAAHGFNAHTAGPLDHVCIREYVDGWRAHGARIGTYQNGVIVWEGGAQ